MLSKDPQMHVQNVKQGLDAWRDALRHRDVFPLGSAEWQEAEEEVRSAAKVYHAEVAQASVRCAEDEDRHRNPWSARLDRRTSEPANSMADVSLA